MSTMLDRGTAIAAAVEVEKYSKQGTELLQSGHLTGAVKAFKYAYKFAGDLDDEYMERACAFNLGAAYIAMGQGEKGLNVLNHAIPTEDRKDGRSNGDLYFNFGLGYESTKNFPEAIRAFNKALGEYRCERDNLSMEIETLLKLAVLCHNTRNNHLMNTYHQLAEAYAMQDNIEKQMWALCEKANAYNSYGDIERAESAADECYKLSEKCDNTAESGNVFNDLGLLYTQLQKYDKAVKCFEEALPLVQTSEDRKREAVVRQNLGAAYNFIGEYQRAISFHKSAADMHARLQNRNSQGQCYANLAYAYSQIGDIHKSKEAFKHALLAAEDTDDNRTTWQVSEGLGSVAFSEENFDESIEFFKKALGVLAAKESNITAQSRIVEKLKQALEAQIKEREKPFGHITKEDVGPLKSGFKRASRPTADQPIVEEVLAVSRVNDPQGKMLQKRFVRVSNSNSTKRFSKVARGLSDLMEPVQLSPTPRQSGSLQGETLRPVQSESEEGSSESESESETESEKEAENFKTETPRPGASSMSKNVETGSLDTEHGSEEESSSGETGEESSEEDEDAKAVHEQMKKYKGESGPESEEDKDRGDEKTGRKKAVERKEEESSGSTETESGSETGSDTDDEAPPVPLGTIPKTGMINTYEKAPQSRPGSKKKMNYADINFDGSPRRGESNKSRSHPNYLQSSDEDSESMLANMGTSASGNYANDEVSYKSRKRGQMLRGVTGTRRAGRQADVHDEDDPLYQSIPTSKLKGDDIIQAKAPTTYPDFASLPRGENAEEESESDESDRERIMYSKHQQDQLGKHSAPPLPSRGEKDSKTCSIM